MTQLFIYVILKFKIYYNKYTKITKIYKKSNKFYLFDIFKQIKCLGKSRYFIMFYKQKQ